MASQELPSRAKPEPLHEICRHLRESGPTEKTQLYDQMDVDRRQIRAGIDYGVELGFLDMDGETVSLEGNGHVLSFAESLTESSVRGVFSDAIETYQPYREAFLWIHADEMVEVVNGDECVKQSSFTSAVEKSTGNEYSRREINLLIKTAEAAGLGEFITGRKGLETRLKASDQLEDFMQKLIDQYGSPKTEESKSENEAVVSDPDNAENDGIQTTVVHGEGSKELKITAEWVIDEKSEEEIAQLIREIREMGADQVA